MKINGKETYLKDYEKSHRQVKKTNKVNFILYYISSFSHKLLNTLNQKLSQTTLKT